MRYFQLATCLILLSTCRGEPRTPEHPPAVLSFGAYSTAREVYHNEILPAFARHLRETQHKEVTFEESYQASGALTRAIASGFEADIAALSLAPDVERLIRAGVADPDWQQRLHNGIVTRTLVVFAVRPGNPNSIHRWDDLLQPGLKILMPNIKTSGGAMWNVAAIWGSAILTGHGDPQGFLSRVLQHVIIMDKGARESLVNFEGGVGDVAITYESEAIIAKKNGRLLDYVIPSPTLLIENPVAIMTTNTARHHNQALASAFIDFLGTPFVQQAFERYGFRLATPAPDVPIFSIDDLGGWQHLMQTLFAADGIYDRAQERGRQSQQDTAP